MLLTVGDLVEELVVELTDDLRRGATAEVRTVRVRGGSAANVAAITCERGGAARFVGLVGADAIGRALVADLADRGVDVAVKPHGVTGATLNLIQDGYRTVLVDRGVAASLAAIDTALLAGTRQVFVPARSLMADPMAECVQQMLSDAAERRVPATIGGFSAEEVAIYGAEAFLFLMETLRPDAIILTARDHEALGLGPRQPVGGAATTVVRHPRQTVIVAIEGDGQISFSAVPVVAPPVVVDRTGAEDGFIAGYLMSRATGAGGRAAVDAGHRVAAMVLSRLGPTTR